MKIRNLNEFQFRECLLCPVVENVISCTVKNCINLLEAVVAVAVAMSQSTTLYLISLRTFFSFCWQSASEREGERKIERERESRAPFIAFHIHMHSCIYACVSVCTIKHWCQNLICCINRFEPLTHSCIRFIFVENSHRYTVTVTNKCVIAPRWECSTWDML